MELELKKSVGNVLNGQTADGASPLITSLNFTKREIVRSAFADIASDIISQIRQGGIALDTQSLTALIYKLATHCSKHGWQTEQAIASLRQIAPGIIDAVLEEPDLLANWHSLKSNIAGHAMRAVQKDSTALKAIACSGAHLTFPAEPAIIAQADDPSYMLVELTSPAHFLAETATLGHCIGNSFNINLLKEKGLSKTDPGAVDYLTYAIKIRHKEVRVFSLRKNGRPCATLEYNERRKEIKEIQGNPRTIDGTEEFFSALCQTIGLLSAKLPIGHINGLPRPIAGTVLTAEGKNVPFDKTVAAADILAGLVKVDNLTPAHVLDELAASSRLTLDVTGLDLSRLPEHIKCNLISSAPTFDAPLLQASGDIKAPNATSFSTPLLRQAGEIDACKAEHFNAPLLQISGKIEARRAMDFIVSSLRHSGDIHADSAANFIVPQLKISGDINAHGAISFSAPWLKASGSISANRATSFYIPLLRRSRFITVRQTMDFSAPNLRHAIDIGADSAMNFSAPWLQTAGKVDANSAAVFSAPHLKAAEYILIPNATVFEASSEFRDKLVSKITKRNHTVYKINAL